MPSLWDMSFWIPCARARRPVASNGRGSVKWEPRSAEGTSVVQSFRSQAPAEIDGDITKPIRLNPVEKTLGGFSAAPSAVPTPAGKSLWDKTAALARLGGDEELLLELCQIFLQESPELLVKLRRAIVDGDARAVMRAAHSLKGELGYLGAAWALQAAQQLEDMGHDNHLSHSATALHALEQEMADLHRELTDPAAELP